jgi:energy-coupling factor transport system permease protein
LPEINFTKLPVIHRLDIRTKILGFCGVIIITFLFEDPLYILVIALSLSVLGFILKLSIKTIKNILTPLIPLFIGIILLTGFAYAPNRFQLETSRFIILYLLPGQRLGISAGGILLGMTFLIRLFIMVTVSSIFTLISSLDDLIQFFQKLKIPYEFSFMITTAIRFIPTIDHKRILIFDAQKARGANFNEKSLIGQFKAHISIMVPLIINSILMADALAIAMLNRGFGYAKTWTNLLELALTPKDYWAIFIILLLLGLGLYIKIGLHQGSL